MNKNYLEIILKSSVFEEQPPGMRFEHTPKEDDPKDLPHWAMRSLGIGFIDIINKYKRANLLTDANINAMLLTVKEATTIYFDSGLYPIYDTCPEGK